ncbi:hypothetical protein HRbin36_00410 [bacterium HR36]|nr:hypothetical protein HRbin36_00410 [bacterium HR36]
MFSRWKYCALKESLQLHLTLAAAAFNVFPHPMAQGGQADPDEARLRKQCRRNQVLTGSRPGMAKANRKDAGKPESVPGTVSAAELFPS